MPVVTEPLVSQPIRRRSPQRRAGSRTLLVRVSAVLVLLSIWELLVLAKIWPSVILPGPVQVWDQLLATSDSANGQGGYAGSTLVERLGVSLRRVAYGSAYGVLIGLALGLAMGLIPIVRAVTEPAVTFLRALPPLAYLSLLVIWFGIDEEPKVYLLMIAAFPPVAVAAAAAVSGVNRQYVEAAQALGASRLNVLTSVILPASAPEIITGIRLAVGIAYSSVVAAETVNGADGIGGMVLNAQRYNQTSVVILGLIVIGLTGLIIDTAIVAVQRTLSPWRGRV